MFSVKLNLSSLLHNPKLNLFLNETTVCQLQLNELCVSILPSHLDYSFESLCAIIPILQRRRLSHSIICPDEDSAKWGNKNEMGNV